MMRLTILRYILLWIYSLQIYVSHGQSSSDSNAKTNIFQIFFGIPNRIRTCNCRCGLPNRQSKLLGGADLQPYEFPWLAQIHVNGILPIQGSLINDRYVISSATALIGLSPFDVKVELGRFDACHSDVTSSMLSVTDIFIHPEFLYISRQNDVALLRLNTFIPYHRRVLPICLPLPNQRYTHRVATLASWLNGLSANNQTLTTCYPRKIELPIIEPMLCSEPLLATQSCMGIIGASSVLCKNDAGASVLNRNQNGYYELIGILGDKQSCQTTAASSTGAVTSSTTIDNNDKFNHYLAMFTRVNSYLNWILENTRDGCYCNKP